MTKQTELILQALALTVSLVVIVAAFVVLIGFVEGVYNHLVSDFMRHF